MKANAYPTFTKLLVARFGTTIAALLAVVLVAGSQQVFGDEIKDFDKTTEALGKATNDTEVSKIAKDATDTIDKANEEAKANLPGQKAKGGADRWDGKGRDTDDAPTDKDDAKKDAEDGAKRIADKYAKADDDPEKAENYMKALKKRRDARKILKAAIKRLTDFRDKAKGGSYTQGLVGPLNDKIKDLTSKLTDAEITISLSRTATGLGAGESYASLTSTGKIKVTTSGTGETIEHVADLKIQNTTRERISFVIRPMILESVSGKSQDFACPQSETVVIPPGETVTVPVRGICLRRSRPPPGPGATDDLVVNDGSKTTTKTARYSPPQVGEILRTVDSICAATEKLEKEGRLKKGVPYNDAKMRTKIVIEHVVWTNPTICNITKETPETKDDLKETIYRQAREHGKVTKETEKKLDEGTDGIWTSIELADKEAKNFKKPAPKDEGPINVDDGTGKKDETKPATQEKAPDGKLQKDEKPTDKSDQPETKDSGETPLGATKEKKPKEKKRTAIEEARDRVEKAYRDFDKAETLFKNNNPKYKQLEEEIARSKAGSEEVKKLIGEQGKLQKPIWDEFSKSPEGRDLKRKVDDAEHEWGRLAKIEEAREGNVQKEMEKYGIPKEDEFLVRFKDFLKREKERTDKLSPDEKPKAPAEKPKPVEGKDTKGEDPSKRQTIE